jgi:hypothetical protein
MEGIMKAKELALTAIFIAIGAGLYSFTPQIGNVTPDTVICFTSLAILLVKPRPMESLGIGLVAGLIGMFFSKSAVPWLNIPCHMIGALCAAIVARYIQSDLLSWKISWKAALAVGAYSLISGAIFITIYLFMGVFPAKVYWTVVWPAVLLTTLVNIIIAVILYIPAKALYLKNA